MGRGSYGTVYQAIHKKTNTVVALKKMEILPENEADIQNEVKFMQKCNGPYVVQYYGSAIQGNTMWVTLW